ncbi:MAG: hypothetical protein ACRDHY_09915 [Anaerolineales bacterium]
MRHATVGTVGTLVLALIPLCALTDRAAAAEQRRDAALLELRTRAERRADLKRRERELRSRPRAAVEIEVRQRAQELGATGSVEILTDLLFRRAWLELEVAKCSLMPTAGSCAGLWQDLESTEAEFERRSGWRPADFKRGRRGATLSRQPLPNTGRPGAAIFAADSTRTDPYNCLCSVSVSSLDRWMNRYWGLECACHSGHGVCSNDLDWCGIHTSGQGAMTGEIRAYFGGDARGIDCPDDHRTCFKGNLPSKPGGGEWSNVCNCDTSHAQLSNPDSSFYGGDVTHSELVGQATFWDMVGDGACDWRGVQVEEFIEENDPWCCDDPMGTLIATAWVQEGTVTTDVPVAAENCNGGSQSGQWPYCGTFGATIRITTSCTTRVDDGFASCSGRCGEVLDDATCNCDFSCQSYGDCCFDYCNECAANGDNPPFECNAGNQ